MAGVVLHNLEIRSIWGSVWGLMWALWCVRDLVRHLVTIYTFLYDNLCKKPCNVPAITYDLEKDIMCCTLQLHLYVHEWLFKVVIFPFQIIPAGPGIQFFWWQCISTLQAGIVMIYDPQKSTACFAFLDLSCAFCIFSYSYAYLICYKWGFTVMIFSVLSLQD